MASHDGRLKVQRPGQCTDKATDIFTSRGVPLTVDVQVPTGSCHFTRNPNCVRVHRLISALVLAPLGRIKRIEVIKPGGGPASRRVGDYAGVTVTALSFRLLRYHETQSHNSDNGYDVLQPRIHLDAPL